MAKSETKPSCFIIMPITTPPEVLVDYRNDVKHFTHVLECLFLPALDSAGFTAILPKAVGSGVIHADFIKQLSTCELVLCDMSTLNANVFFELGIRTALNKPVALVVDDKTEKTVPFDTGIINFHSYLSSLDPWELDKQQKELEKHIREVQNKTPNYNALWKYFGVAQTGTFKPEDAQLGDKMDLLIRKVSAIEIQKKMRPESIETISVLGSQIRCLDVSVEQARVLKELVRGKSVEEIGKALQLAPEEVMGYIIPLMGQTHTIDLDDFVLGLRVGEFIIRERRNRESDN